MTDGVVELGEFRVVLFDPRLRGFDLGLDVVDAFLGHRAAFGDFLAHVRLGCARREPENPQKKRSARERFGNPPAVDHLHLLKKG